MHRLLQHRSNVQQYAEELTERALKCGDVSDDDELMGIFIEGLKEEIRRSVQHYWPMHRSIRMYSLIAYDVSIDTTNTVRKRELGTHGH